MSVRFLKASLAVAAIALGVPSLSQASTITIDPGTGTTTTFTATGLTQGPGPVVVNGFTVTGSNVAFGNAPYGLGNNGAWTSFSFLAGNSNSTSITIDLGGLFGLVGGFANYSTPADPSGTHATMVALAADGTTVLETFDLETSGAISTPGGSNAGAFRGFSRGTNDIRFLRLSGDFILIHTLEVGSVSVVPALPGWMLIALGVALAVAAAIKLRRPAMLRR